MNVEEELLSEGFGEPIGAAVRSVAARTSPGAGWVIVIVTTYAALIPALSPLSMNAKTSTKGCS
jgi:hypothetical protein